MHEKHGATLASGWQLIKPGAYYFSRQKSVNSNDTIATSIGQFKTKNQIPANENHLFIVTQVSTHKS